MADEWIVRVEGKEYGPVRTDVLREWRREGRLIPANEVRQLGENRWIAAGELPEVFSDLNLTEAPALPQEFETPRSWSQVVTETVRIYHGGFVSFMFFGLLTAVPMFILQWTLPPVSMPELLQIVSRSSESAAIPAPSPICMAMLIAVLSLWPISTAGFQLTANDILWGKSRSLGVRLSASLHCWSRVAGGALLVYASYSFWILIPLAAMIPLITSGNLLVVVLVSVLGVAVIIYMIARLYINFLFWHQTVVIGEQPPLIAVAESKELARSQPDAPPLDRPLYRGAIVASVWLLLLLVLTFGVDLMFGLIRIAGAENPEQALELAKNAARNQTPDALMVAANIGIAAMNLLLRPLLAAAFVVLYYDAKARSGKVEVEPTLEN